MLYAERTTMAPTAQTMSLPSTTTFLLDAVADAAAAERSASNFDAAAAPPTSEEAAAAATTYTTPKRVGGLAAVTPGENDPQFADADEEGAADASPEKNAADQALVSASSTEEAAAAEAHAAAPQAQASSPVAPPAVQAVQVAIATGPSAAAAAATPAAVGSARKISAAAAHLAATPSIQLGPRVTPALRKSPPQTAVKQEYERTVSNSSAAGSSPVKPRNLDGALETDTPSHQQYSAPPLSAYAGQAPQEHSAVKQEECPSTPAQQLQQNHHIPAPSSFLAAKISPLRSSARRNGEKKGAGAPTLPSRDKTPPPAVAASNLDPKLSPGMFLSPRTPKAYQVQGSKNCMSSGMTPSGGLTPGLTPTNFASDFGRGEKKEGNMSALDASNVFAWLHSPGGQGLFSPTGGFNSVTNTPRGMYGFSGPAGSAGKGPPKLAPSSTGTAHGFLEPRLAGGDIGVNTPKITDGQRSMICISPLASRRSGKKSGGAGAGAPDTPMSINFSEVFASPRLPSPRLSRQPPSAVKREPGTSSDGQSSPVASALHTAERDINLDDDLNALLQLAETATPGGGRPMTFMSPLLTNSLRRAHTAELGRNGKEPPSSLQLPIISGSSISDSASPQKLARKGSSGAISPPQLAIRSTSSGVMDGSPVKSSLKKKSKKRKAPAAAATTSTDHYAKQYGHQRQQPQQQQTGYSQQGMTHFRHSGRHTKAAQAAAAAAAHQQYYHQQHPGYHAHQGYGYGHHPTQQQHYAYSDQQQAEAAAAAAAAASPVKPAAEPSPVKSTSSRSRRATARSRSRAKRASPVTTKADSRPTTPSSTSSSKRARKATAKATAKASGAAAKKSNNKNAVSDPADKERITLAIHAVNSVYGAGSEKDKKLAAATLRGVTMRPSGKWQAQLYYAGKSRYIGVFDSKEKASLAYEIAREVLKTDGKEEAPSTQEETDKNVCLARKAAFAGVNEHSN